jgi:hypothetical protein
MKHIECFCCAVRQIDTPLNIHLGQEWPTIFHHNTDAMTPKTNVQKSAKDEGSVCGYKFIVAIDLAVRQIFSSFQRS